ncbi:hypothetical protein [Nocardioides sp. zg-1228]|uniref:hypothetical protein n=1 Tax=Nocardioides sp. zg-1228 TaxID=2763008 RepID=UPI00164342BA|nr:hypothetical protein [Nocardioides sp. zg-1228]MBC2932981.1 hypothetical protein [Nocardioides sp. zg-1228]QSF56821.1 hypothetical protein JX575_14615 [Nocardioides sp. zg-1228]
MRRTIAIATAIGLGGGLLVGVTAPAGGTEPSAPGGALVGQSFEIGEKGPRQRRAGAEQLISATATFTAANRVAGMPTSTAPHHQFVMPGGSLSVTVDYGYHWQDDSLIYDYSLDTAMGAGDPDASTRTVLGFGSRQGTSCTVEEVSVAWLYRYIPDVLLYDDKETPDLASAAGWDCAVLLVDSGSGTPPYDAFVSVLDVVAATPELAVRAPRKDRLVKGVWTRIPVTVSNASPEGIGARDVAVTGAGKGVKVRPLALGSLQGQDDIDGHVWARLTRPKGTLRLTVSEKGQALGRATVKLRRRPAPAPPKAGSWSAGGVSFTVRGSKVRGFRINARTTCGGYPDMPTTTNNTYSFVTTTIPRNNEVVGTERNDQESSAAYAAYLDLEFVSRTKAVGRFSYYGPARCTAIERFTARLRR